VPGVVPPQVQDPALALIEPHQVPLCPIFRGSQGSCFLLAARRAEVERACL